MYFRIGIIKRPFEWFSLLPADPQNIVAKTWVHRSTLVRTNSRAFLFSRPQRYNCRNSIHFDVTSGDFKTVLKFQSSISTRFVVLDVCMASPILIASACKRRGGARLCSCDPRMSKTSTGTPAQTVGEGEICHRRVAPSFPTHLTSHALDSMDLWRNLAASSLPCSKSNLLTFGPREKKLP